MLTKIKYVGTGEWDLESGATYNNVYVVLGFVEQSGQVKAIIIDDSDSLYLTNAVTQPLLWELVSAETVGGVTIYP